MPPPVPPELTDAQESELWRNIARLFEDYMPSSNESDYVGESERMRIRSFLKVSKLITAELERNL